MNYEKAADCVRVVAEALEQTDGRTQRELSRVLKLLEAERDAALKRSKRAYESADKSGEARELEDRMRRFSEKFGGRENAT